MEISLENFYVDTGAFKKHELINEGVNGVNQLATKGEKYY